MDNGPTMFTDYRSQYWPAEYFIDARPHHPRELPQRWEDQNYAGDTLEAQHTSSGKRTWSLALSPGLQAYVLTFD